MSNADGDKRLYLVAQVALNFRYRTRDAQWSNKREETLASLIKRVSEKHSTSGTPVTDALPLPQAINVHAAADPEIVPTPPRNRNRARRRPRPWKTRISSRKDLEEPTNSTHDDNRERTQDNLAKRSAKRFVARKQHNKHRNASNQSNHVDLRTNKTGNQTARKKCVARSSSPRPGTNTTSNMLHSIAEESQRLSSAQSATSPLVDEQKTKITSKLTLNEHDSNLSFEQMVEAERLFQHITRLKKHQDKLVSPFPDVDEGVVTLEQVQLVLSETLPGEKNIYLIRRIFAVMCGCTQEYMTVDQLRETGVTFVLFCRFIAICIQGDLKQKLNLCFKILDGDCDGYLSQSDLFCLLKYDMNQSIPEEAEVLTCWIRNQTMSNAQIQEEVHNLKCNVSSNPRMSTSTRNGFRDKATGRTNHHNSISSMSWIEDLDLGQWDRNIWLTPETLHAIWPTRKVPSIITHLIKGFPIGDLSKSNHPLDSPKKANKFAGVMGVSRAKRGLLRLMSTNTRVRRTGIGLPKQRCTAGEYLKRFTTEDLLNTLDLTFSQAEHLCKHFIRFTKGHFVESCKVSEVLNFLEYSPTSLFGKDYCSLLIREAVLEGFQKTGREMDHITLSSFLTTVATAHHGTETSRAILAFSMYKGSQTLVLSQSIQNRHGVLTSARLESLLNAKLQQVAPVEANKLLNFCFRKVTTNHDSDISFEEFCLCLLGHKALSTNVVANTHKLSIVSQRDELRTTEPEPVDPRRASSTSTADHLPFQLLCNLWISFGMDQLVL